MSLIRIQDVSKNYDGNQVLREIYFRVRAGEKVGLIGKNGTGKTTLLKLILGEKIPDEGRVDLNHDLQIGYFSQFSTLAGEQSVVQVLQALFEPVQVLEESLLKIEIALEEGDLAPDQVDPLIDRQSELLTEMDRIDGWNYEYKIDTALSRLGFDQKYRTRSVDQLSGGWRNRAALAHILLQEPDVLLLDEPTNFLDIAGLTWLEEYLLSHRGALILVSHDRHFLDRVVNRVVEIENYHLQDYDGGFTAYIRQKPLRLKSLDKQFVHEEALLVYEAEAIKNRQEIRRNPGRALKRRLANIKKQAEPHPVDRVITDIYQNLKVSKDLCQVEGLTKAYGEQRLFTDLNFDIRRGDRIAVVGPNGCGKTTLLRAIVQEDQSDDREPLFDAGRVKWAKGAAFVYYYDVFQNLDLNDSVTHAVNVVGMAHTAPRKKVNAFLGLFQFSELDLNQKIGTLSGGQRARVALAQCLLSGANVIILDEPTNHLDLTSTQVMERALVHFPGAVVVVSHDRFFIDKVATKMIVFKGDGYVESYYGNWTMYEMSARSSE